MKMRLIYLFIISIVISSCISQHKNDDFIILNFDQPDIISTSDLLEISFVKLETSDSCLLGMVNQLAEINGQFLLLDGAVSKKLYLFEKDGQFVKQIGKTGAGPGEYLMPLSFSLDSIGKQLAVIDADAQKILYYDLPNFDFVKESKIPFSSSKMEFISENSRVWYTTDYEGNNMNGYLLLTDSALDVKKSLLKREFQTGYYMGMPNNLYKFSDCLSVYDPFTPDVYRIENDSIRLVYHLSFGKHQIAPIDFLKKAGGTDGNYIPALKKSSYIFFYSVYENQDLLWIPYFVDETMYFGVYDKTKDKVYNFTQKKMQKELCVGALSSPVGIVGNHSFVSLLRPGLIMQLQKEGANLDKRLLDIINGSTEDDNPVLVVYKLKR